VVNPEILSVAPDIFPDYTDVTVPATIAPLNFLVVEKGQATSLHLRAEGGKSGLLEIRTTGFISFPEKKWKRLLAENIGDTIRFTLSVKSAGHWKQYAPFSIYISPHPIDHGLAYRLIAPGYEVYSKMGIYQRSLSDFKERPVFENTIVPGSCVNCHSFNQTHPQEMSLHIRGTYGGTIIQSNEILKIVDTKTEETVSACVYPYWHPSGRFIAYSVNKTLQTFHSAKEKLIEVLDMASDIVVYDLETNELLSCDLLMTSNFETFPVFSPDGKTLYFCCASEQKLPEDYNKIRYNLCSISFDASTRTFSTKIDTLIQADTAGKSISFPKPSFDGKFIMYTLLDYGNFGIWHPEADLYVLNLEDHTTRELTEANSPYADSYHNWSSNSRWFVFGSRRMDGLYTRPYIAAIDENGHASKPFLLPQKNPTAYIESLYSYNIPEFINAPIKLDANRAAGKLLSPEREKVTYVK
jgi:Tol biopolymer transport system component